jgi:hypothetical protein
VAIAISPHASVTYLNENQMNNKLPFVSAYLRQQIAGEFLFEMDRNNIFLWVGGDEIPGNLSQNLKQFFNLNVFLYWVMEDYEVILKMLKKKRVNV